MKEETAFTAKGRSAEERRAQLAALVAEGEVTPEHAALIDFRDPPAHVREYARQLGLARQSRVESLSRALAP